MHFVFFFMFSLQCLVLFLSFHLHLHGIYDWLQEEINYLLHFIPIRWSDWSQACHHVHTILVLFVLYLRKAKCMPRNVHTKFHIEHIYRRSRRAWSSWAGTWLRWWKTWRSSRKRSQSKLNNTAVTDVRIMHTAIVPGRITSCYCSQLRWLEERVAGTRLNLQEN